MGSAIVLLAVIGVLVLAGMLLAWKLIDLRLESFARRLDACEDRLRSFGSRLEETLEVGAAPPLPEGGGGLPEQALAGLERVSERAEELSRRVSELVEHQRALAERLEQRDRARTLDLVELRLLARGYRSIRFPSPPTEEGGGRLRVAVEAARDGLPYRGHVTVEQGRVVAEELSCSYEMFP